MSWQMVNATKATATQLRDALPGIARHRPSVAAAALVARELADAYRHDRGCVNESVEQICDATGLSDGQVRDALGALDELGWWVAVTRGNRHRPSVRAPGPVLTAALDQVLAANHTDPYSADHPALYPAPGGDDPTPTARITPRSSPSTQRDIPRSTDSYSAEPPAEKTGPENLERGKMAPTARAGPRHPIPRDVLPLSTGSRAWRSEPAEIDQRPPPPPDHPDHRPDEPFDDRGSAVWAARLAASVGDDCPLDDSQRSTWFHTTHREHPQLTDDELVAELRARRPRAAGAQPVTRQPSPARRAAEAALDARDRVATP